MDEKKTYKVMKITEALANGTDKMGQLATGQDPLEMNDMDLVLLLKDDGLEFEDVKSLFNTMDLEINHLGLAAMALAVSKVKQDHLPGTSPSVYCQSQSSVKSSHSATNTPASSTARPVPRTGSRYDGEVEMVYPGLSQDCILKICNAVLTNPDLRVTLMKIDPNVGQLLPDNVVGSFIKQQIFKTNSHNPGVQANGMLIDALKSSKDHTKMLRLLDILESLGDADVFNEIKDAHVLEIAKYRN